MSCFKNRAHQRTQSLYTHYGGIAFLSLFLCLYAGPAHAGFIIQRPVYLGLTDGLVGYWSFDGPDMAKSKNNMWALDRSGKGNTGRYLNATSTARVAGKIGQALNFDDINDIVLLGNSTAIEPSNLTVSVWVKIPKVPSDYNGIIAKDSGLLGGYRVMINPTGDNPQTVGFRTYTGATNSLVSSNTVPINTWTHITATYDGAVMRIYFNGVQDPTTLAASGNISYRANKQAEIGFGDYYEPCDANCYPFDGLIDEVRIYNRALSVGEIRRLYKIGSTLVVNKSRTDTLTDGLVGYWTFDGPDMTRSGAGRTTALDLSGGGNNAVVTMATGTAATSTAMVPGKIGQALRYMGGSKVTAGNPSSLNDLGPLTWSLWIMPTKLLSGNQIMDKDTSGISGRIRIELTGTDGKFEFFKNFTTTNLTRDAAAGSLTLNKWQLLTLTWDGSASSTRAHIYVNGAEVSYSASVDGHGSPNSDAALPLVIGGRGDGTLGFQGLMDEVRVYNRELSLDEIRRIYKIGGTLVVNTSRKDTLTDGLVGYWSFDGGTVLKSNHTTILDLSGNNKTGYFTNGTSTGQATGKIGQGLTFDGVNDYVSIASASVTYSSFTISAWFKSNLTVSTDDQDIYRHSNLTNYIDCGSTDDAGKADQLRMALNNGGGDTSYYGTSDIVDRNWHHVVCVRNNGRIQLYVDSKLETDTADTISGDITVSAKAALGADAALLGNDQLNGIIDDVRIYNYALSAGEIRRLYSMGGGH